MCRACKGEGGWVGGLLLSGREREREREINGAATPNALMIREKKNDDAYINA